MYKIAVYGSLRATLHNHGLIKDSNFLGIFNSEPIYTLYDLGSYPGLKENGKTSVVFEVYEVDEKTLKNVNYLEGYNPDSNNNNFYNRIEMDTPYGKAYTYMYVPVCDNRNIVKSGDWRRFINRKYEIIK